YGASASRLARAISPVAAPKTTSTPRPDVASATPAASSVERESKTCSTPSARSQARFSGLPAVARTWAPAARATPVAANPAHPPLPGAAPPAALAPRRRRHVRGRRRGRRDEIEPRRHARGEARRHDRVGAEAAERDGEHAIARRELADPRPHAEHDAGALSSE